MGFLSKYCLTVRCIDGLDTYIISPEKCGSLIADQELPKRLNAVSQMTVGLIQMSEKADSLYFAFTHHKAMAGRRLEWWPVLCYKNEDSFYHVRYRDSWMCRECGYKLYAPMIMPMCEAEPDFYYGTKNRFPDIPPGFKKLSCPKCGRLLQNHFIILESVH